MHFMFGSRVGFSGSADQVALFSVRSNPSWWGHDLTGHDSWQKISTRAEQCCLLPNYFCPCCTSLTYARLATDRQTDGRTHIVISLEAPFTPSHYVRRGLITWTQTINWWLPEPHALLVAVQQWWLESSLRTSVSLSLTHYSSSEERCLVWRLWRLLRRERERASRWSSKHRQTCVVPVRCTAARC